MIIQITISLILAALLGFWVSNCSRDELLIGRKWFVFITIISSTAAIVSFITVGGSKEGIAFGFSWIIVGIISYISYIKSFDKKWTNMRRNV